MLFIGIIFYLECKYLIIRGKLFSRNCFLKYFIDGLFMYVMVLCLCICIYIYICVIYFVCFVICKFTVYVCFLSVVICICVDSCFDSSSVISSLILYLQLFSEGFYFFFLFFCGGYYFLVQLRLQILGMFFLKGMVSYMKCL